jgi:hypothetical protein
MEGGHHPRDGMADGQVDPAAPDPPVRSDEKVDGQAFFTKALDLMGIPH